MNADFKPSNLTLADISKGQRYNVHPKDNWDVFTHEFVGRVVKITAHDVVVEDQDGDCFDVDPDQLTVITD